MILTQKEVNRFRSKVNFVYLPDGQLDYEACWLWTGKPGLHGHGQIGIRGKTFLVHRLMYMLEIGEIPISRKLYRTCKNKLCVNPNHLYLNDTNIKDGIFSKTDIERFQQNVQFKFLDNGQLDHESCWEWTNCCDEEGYGKIGIKNKIYLTHRIAYMIERGKIPKEYCVRHDCDNPPCVNPNHLRIGTMDDDIQDKVLRNRQAQGDTHPQSTLTSIDIREILTGIHNDKYFSTRQISKDYNVTIDTIRCFLTKKTWKPVTSIITHELGVSLKDLYEKIKRRQLTDAESRENSRRLTTRDLKEIQWFLNQKKLTIIEIAKMIKVSYNQVKTIKENSKRYNLVF